VLVLLEIVAGSLAKYEAAVSVGTSKFLSETLEAGLSGESIRVTSFRMFLKFGNTTTLGFWGALTPRNFIVRKLGWIFGVFPRITTITSHYFLSHHIISQMV
jgi:hypothetical protein